MSGFAVLGQPLRGLPGAYRGSDRDIPIVVDALGASHPANRALLHTLEDHDVSSRIQDFEAARTLAVQYSTPETGVFEVVEITSEGEEPMVGRDLLGFDVAFEGGLTSLIASLLLFDDAAARPATEDSSNVALRHAFSDRLNHNRLFSSREDARSFLSAAIELGPWEGPDVMWAISAIWAVPAGAS